MTEGEVRFEAVGGETRVTVEHRGWETIPQKHVAPHGFELMLFQRRLGEFWRGLLKGMSGGLCERRLWEKHKILPVAQRDRKSVVSGKSVSVRVDRGGRRIINKKTTQ